MSSLTLVSSCWLSLSLLACACGGNQTGSDDDVGEAQCLPISLRRAVCVTPCATVDKQVDLCTLDRGCSTITVCYADQATGDLYYAPCSARIEGVSTSFRSCTTEEDRLLQSSL